jgi:hypothetical protein
VAESHDPAVVRRKDGTQSLDARRYSWEPFKPGNVLAVKHALYSDREVHPLAADLAQRVLSERPELAAYPYAVSRWARAEARAAMANFWLDVLDFVALEGGEAVPRERWLREVRSDERRAAEEAARLGLDPTSEARLRRDASQAGLNLVALDELTEQGRSALAARGPHNGTRADDALPAASQAAGPDVAGTGPQSEEDDE